MSMQEKKYLVDQLAKDTLRVVDNLIRHTPKADIIIYAGSYEIMAIRYVNDPLYYDMQTPYKERFMGCQIVEVRADKHFNVAIQCQ
jgi:hypothetical protein